LSNLDLLQLGSDEGQKATWLSFEKFDSLYYLLVDYRRKPL